jgi:hypothetical protein
MECFCCLRRNVLPMNCNCERQGICCECQRCPKHCRCGVRLRMSGCTKPKWKRWQCAITRRYFSTAAGPHVRGCILIDLVLGKG